LIARAVTIHELGHLTDAVPAHRMQTVAQLARHCAMSWEMFARKLEHRAELSAELAAQEPADVAGPVRRRVIGGL
ncbi:hypothetical protein AB0K48_58805, partial [Nonomuraea sp. NPDC055795]